MSKLKTQATEQIKYAKSHTGKTLGSAAGIATGVVYGMSGGKDNWVVAGFAIAGGILGGVLGAMFDHSKESADAASNFVGSVARRKAKYGFESPIDEKNIGGKYSNAGGRHFKVVCPEGTEQAGNTFWTTGDIIHLEHNGDVQGWEEWACGRKIIGDVGAANPSGGSTTGLGSKPDRPRKLGRKIGLNKMAGMNTLVQPFSRTPKVGSRSRQIAQKTMKPAELVIDGTK
jgi:hypothetical protein